MPLTYNSEQIRNFIKELVSNSSSKNLYIRIIITRGIGDLTLAPNPNEKNNLIILSTELPKNPSWWYEKGVSIIVSKIRRNSPDAIDPNLKSGNYLNNVLAMNEAKKYGAFDAVMLNDKNFITEVTVSNIWIVTKDNIIKTPPLSAGILEGITRSTLIKAINRDKKYTAIEENITVQELLDAKECFLSSSTREIVPVVKINESITSNGRPGSTTKYMSELYQQEIQNFSLD